MGTWGTGPFDSDDAGDLLAGAYQTLSKPISKVLKAKTSRAARYHYQQARAAASTMVVLSKGTKMVLEDDLRDADKALMIILADHVWIDEWEWNAWKVTRSIQGEVVAVREQIQEIEKRWKKMSKAHAVATKRKRQSGKKTRAKR